MGDDVAIDASAGGIRKATSATTGVAAAEISVGDGVPENGAAQPARAVTRKKRASNTDNRTFIGDSLPARGQSRKWLLNSSTV